MLYCVFMYVSVYVCDSVCMYVCESVCESALGSMSLLSSSCRACTGLGGVQRSSRSYSSCTRGEFSLFAHQVRAALVCMYVCMYVWTIAWSSRRQAVGQVGPGYGIAAPTAAPCPVPNIRSALFVK